jgi:hypothetical protein
MNILLWVVQGALAFLHLAGGSYKLFQYEQLAKVPSSSVLPRAGWRVLGVVELVGAVLLVLPTATGWMPLLTPAAAAVLALEHVVLTSLYARRSLVIAASNPLAWSAVMAVMAGFVAYGRYAL